MTNRPPRHAIVIVLGDIAQSPRMVGHVTALAAHGYAVEVIAHAAAALPASIAGTPRVKLHRLPDWQLAGRHRLPRLLFLFYAAARAAGSALLLLWRLLTIARRGSWLIAQNPPAIPTLWACRVAAAARRARWCVDWHNYGDSMLALRLGAGHPVTRLAHRHERAQAAHADLHFCVSAAMRDDLAARWGIAPAHVLRDRPRAELLALRDHVPRARRAAVFARTVGLDVAAADAVLVSATSWSADEDLLLLLDALDRYDARARRAATPWPRLCVVVTGKGPQRAAFEAALGAREYAHAQVVTAWLAEDAYLELLCCADLGISLHRSSSGLDLPMKILDYYGAGLPVCALDYGPCLRELVTPDETGQLFMDADELAQRIEALFVADPGRGALAAMRAQVCARHTRTWLAEWQQVAAPLLDEPQSS